MNNVKLGDRVKDQISGFTGILVADCLWLNGCRRITIQSEELKDGRPIGQETFDVEQVTLVSSGVMPGPQQSTGGPSLAPVQRADSKRI